MEQKTVSFGFSKKKENRTLEKSKISEEDVEKQKDTEYVSELDENFSKRTKQKAKEYVIPLIKENKWRSDKIKSGDQIEDSAVLEIVEDAKKFQESEKGKGQTDLGLNIPLLMQNKVPEGYETDDKLDVGLRPEEPDEAAYDEIPIEQFGIAMLRGMGWKEGQGIGRNKESVAPVVAVLRPKGLGLGADRSKAAQLNNSKKVDEEEEELLTLKKGAYCVLLKGTNKDLYGMIEGMDEDNARVMVKLTLTGKMVSQSQYAIRLVDEKEYTKYSKYLNKGKTDKYKEDEERRKEKDRKREKHHKSRKDKHRDREEESDDNKHSSTDSRKRKHDRLEENDAGPSINGQNGHSQNRSESLWIRPQIRVRIVSKDYKKGRYYNTKNVPSSKNDNTSALQLFGLSLHQQLLIHVEVIDVISPDNCVCRTDDGKVLEGISQSEFETVIPKQENAYVLIVSGKHKGQLAQVMKRDKSRYVASLQLLRDRDEVFKLDFDSICEYSGNIDDEYDF